MPNPPLSDELALEAAATWRRHRRSRKRAAAELGLPESTLDRRLKVAGERGFLLDVAPAMPGFRISRVSEGPRGKVIEQLPEHGDQFSVPAGHVIKGVSALLDPDGNKIAEWVKTREGQPDPAALVDWLKEAFKDYGPAVSPIASPAVADDLLTLIPLADWHLGMFSWHREVGENWDLEIAEQAIGAAVDDLILRTPPSDTAVVLGGGDLIHSDTNENKTARSGNALQVDGRYQKIVMTACRLTERVVNVARRQHGRVIVRILPGNHDEHACVAVAYHLLALYRNEPRVTVDVDPSLFWWHRFGSVFLGATHGHTVKAAKMPSIMAHRKAEEWGLTKYRYVHAFHLHHTAKTITEGEGVVTEIHQSPIPQDAWHYGSGYLSGRSVQAITYHRDFGETGRVRVAMLDGRRA